MTKIQDVALALIKADGAEDPNMPDAVYDDYLLRARYAVEAMMEPDHDMTGAVLKAGDDRTKLVSAWQAMIRAALEETE